MTSDAFAAFGPNRDVPVDGTPDPVETWLDRATRRLRVDREVQLEVRQELRSHLDASIAELRNAGHSDTDARGEALRALGDEDELADQLLNANRRRIRSRAVVAWAVRLLLPPATVALIVYLAASAVGTVALYTPLAHSWGVYDYFRQRVIEPLPPDARTLVEQGEAPWEEQAAIAKALVDRHPADAAYFANYAAAVAAEPRADIFKYPQAGRSLRIPQVDEARLAAALAVLAEGEQREPGNALYPLYAAQLLFRASAVEEDDPALTVQRPKATGEPREWEWVRLTVYDAARFARALEAFRRGAAKPYFRSYSQELAARKVGAFPPPRTLPELSIQAMQHGFTHLHRYPLRAVQMAAFQATDAARAGRIAEARALLHDVRRANALMLADMSHESRVRSALYLDQFADRAEARIAASAGDRAAAERAWQRAEAKGRIADQAARDLARQQYQATTGVPSIGREPKHGLPFLDGIAATADLAPVRRALAASVQQLGVALLSLCALLLAVVYAVAAAPGWLLAPRNAKPPRLFIGWRRLMRVIGIAVVLPLLLFLAVRLSTSRHNAGLAIESLMFQYVVLAAVIALATHVLTRRAVIARAAELGLTLPPSAPARTRAGMIAAFAAATAVAALLVLMSPAAAWVGFRDHTDRVQAQVALVAILWGMVIVFATAPAFAALRRGWPRKVPLAGALPRSAFPVAVVAALTLALVGVPLRWWESRLLRPASASAMFLQPEMPPDSPLRPLADELLAREGVMRK